MEKIDFSPIQDTANEMAIKLAIILVVPLITGLIAKFVLVKIRVPNYPANLISVAVLLFVFFKMITIVLG